MKLLNFTSGLILDHDFKTSSEGTFAELKWQTFPERVIYNSNSNIQDMSRLS